MSQESIARADALPSLLPCPFCNGAAETEKIEDECFGAGCGACGFQLVKGKVGIDRFPSEADAIAAWNRRAPAPLPQADVALAAGGAVQEPLATFDDPRAQQVYAILCNDDDPPMGEPWEGWVARRIADALPREGSTDVRMTAAVRDVLAERERHVSVEGWTPEHDEQHDSGQLADAASCYAADVNGRQGVFFDDGPDDYKSESTHDYWPCDESGKKPTTPRDDLVNACALILAEIECIDRAASSARQAS
ncbi:hypothetical protein BH160DRAFT_3837 [Burkholderia sp. H160]|nr:hypothetical protein BH160DRAFT_3837 [Burkholderia sp. H160]